MVLVLDQSDEGWCRVRKEDGSEIEGLVPANYLSEWASLPSYLYILMYMPIPIPTLMYRTSVRTFHDAWPNGTIRLCVYAWVRLASAHLCRAVLCLAMPRRASPCIGSLHAYTSTLDAPHNHLLTLSYNARTPICVPEHVKVYNMPHQSRKSYEDDVLTARGKGSSFSALFVVRSSSTPRR